MVLEKGIRLKMKGPNIFDYATSELSQDAFLCYLFSFGKEANKQNFPNEYALAHKFLFKCGVGAEEEILSVEKQVDNIDVLVITSKHILIVEDKTYSNEHDNQIIRYVRNMTEDNTKFPTDKKIKVCYLKTGDYVKGYTPLDDVLSNEDCRSLRRQDLIELLKECHQDQVINMFYEHLLKIEKEIVACDHEDIFTWRRAKWFNYLYNLLKNKDKKFDIGNVPNAKGGFYACWFDWEYEGKVEKYKQIEIYFKEGKTDFVNLCFKVASDNKEITSSYKNEMIVWQKEAIQKGYSRPKCWRIGRTTTYACKNGKTKQDIESFINE